MASVERQVGSNTVLSASYVGTSSHRQRVLIEPNPGNAALCLSLSQTSEVLPGPSPAARGGEDTVYYPIAGGQVNGTRGPLGANFGSNALQSTIGHANYNALELSGRHTSGRLEFSAAYTYGKSLDQSSNPAEEVNPIDPGLSYAVSSFDVKHNFVVSYEYQLPIGPTACSEPPDQWLVALRHHPLFYGLPSHDDQQRRQFADRDQSERH